MGCCRRRRRYSIPPYKMPQGFAMRWWWIVVDSVHLVQRSSPSFTNRVINVDTTFKAESLQSGMSPSLRCRCRHRPPESARHGPTSVIIHFDNNTTGKWTYAHRSTNVESVVMGVTTGAPASVRLNNISVLPMLYSSQWGVMLLGSNLMLTS